jgi:hypothetical protein
LRWRRLAAKAEGESGALRERIESAEVRAGWAEAERDAARAEREEARSRAAAAEGAAKGLREALAEARQPWWRRWLSHAWEMGRRSLPDATVYCIQ